MPKTRRRWSGLKLSGVNLSRLQLLGTGLWKDPRVFGDPALQGAWYVGPDPTAPNGFKSFSTRYRSKFGSDRRAPQRSPTMR